MDQDYFDVLIVGAGLSGIGMAHHLQKTCPNLSYSILEARETMGGTWDLFRYPGIRSDSDMYTLGFPFKPWKERKAIADGPSILKYIHDTANEFGIVDKIHYGKKVTSSNWSSDEKKWTVAIEGSNSIKCKFLIMCSGYYDYDEGFTPEYLGRENFQGSFVHPQKWPQDLDYQDKKIIVIGSGATAVTLVPELSKKTDKVIMLQRSPSYVAALPAVDGVAELLKKILPEKFAHHLIRWKNILFSMFFFVFCRSCPGLADRLLKKGVEKSLQGIPDWRTHFTPKYTPWDQRLCFVPDGDLFKALNSKRATIVTDEIENFTQSGLLLKSGKSLDADIIVSATGLKLKFLGGLKINIDGKEIEPHKVVPYKSSMFSGVPNLGMIFGYTNASWTLKCNLTSEWLAKIIRHMDKHNFHQVIPEENPKVPLRPLIDFSSGYFKRATEFLPMQGDRNPWKVNQNYFSDLYTFRARPLADEGLNFQH